MTSSDLAACRMWHPDTHSRSEHLFYTRQY
nr:MAG TPA: hypothetical protein [Caudoviricetes sp.]